MNGGGGTGGETPLLLEVLHPGVSASVTTRKAPAETALDPVPAPQVRANELLRPLGGKLGLMPEPLLPDVENRRLSELALILL